MFCFVTTVSWINTVYSDDRFVCRYLGVTLVIENGYNDMEVKQCLLDHETTESLIFTHSNLTEIPIHVRHLTRLMSLDVSYNRLPNINMAHISSVCHNLTHAVFDFNAITEIKTGDLDCFESLSLLSVANNGLKSLDPMTFGDALQFMHFTNNNLTTVDINLALLPAVRSGTVLVNASWNHISEFTNIKNCTIEDFQPDYAFGFVLLHNNFTTIDINHYFNITNVTNPLQLYRLASGGFDLRFNPFLCDCAMYKLHTLIKQFHDMDPDKALFSVTCYNPPSLRGMRIYSVPDNQFNCSVTKNCPDHCSCFYTIATKTIVVSCLEDYTDHDLPLEIPKAERVVLNIKSSSLQRLSYKRYMSNVTVLDMPQCAVSSMDSTMVSHLNGFQSVWLNDNHLSGLPKAISNVQLKSPTRVSLSGNQFSYDCHDVWMKDWLLRNQLSIVDVKDIVCVGGPENGQVYINIPDDQFVCTVTLTLTQTLLIVGGAVLVVVILMSIVIRKKTTIHVLLIAYCKVRCFRSRVRSNLKYDIFVAHSCVDDDVVWNDIVVRLELHSPPYSVCIAERNFVVGKYITENIIGSIEASVTTLLILSNSFLRSSWCNTEFREAHLRYLRNDDVNMVLVLLEDIDAELLCEELKCYMDTHTYIQYKDKFFWAKLLRALPIRVGAKSASGKSESSPLLGRRTQ